VELDSIRVARWSYFLTPPPFLISTPVCLLFPLPDVDLHPTDTLFLAQLLLQPLFPLNDLSPVLYPLPNFLVNLIYCRLQLSLPHLFSSTPPQNTQSFDIFRGFFFCPMVLFPFEGFEVRFSYNSRLKTEASCSLSPLSLKRKPLSQTVSLNTFVFVISSAFLLPSEACFSP